LTEDKIYRQYAYVNYGCALAVAMKSSKRATIELFYVSKDPPEQMAEIHTYIY